MKFIRLIISLLLTCSGTSITSTALVFENRGSQIITLLDSTPGHQDFGEDTYR
jgi:peptide subunit release factor RF-3